ncbi:MAG: STAS domain-containing protein [Bacteroidota bacterium]
MTYSFAQHNDTTQVLSVQNLLNEYDNKQLLQEVYGFLDRGFHNFVVDLSNAEFMNSVGLNFLISIMTRSQEVGGNLALANAPDQVVNLLEVTKLKPLIKLSPSVVAAVDALNE